MRVSEECKDLFKAISAAQGEFTTVEKNAVNPHFKSKFAPLDSIIEMIRPILPKYGLSVMQHCDVPETSGGIIVETVIAHESGQYISSRLFMPAMKNDPQGYGGSISYCRRYSLAAALGIVSDEDVDGNETGKTAKQQERSQQQQQRPQENAPPPQGNTGELISEAQRKMLFAKINAKGADEAEVKKHFGIASLSDLPKAKVNDALKYIDGK